MVNLKIYLQKAKKSKNRSQKRSTKNRKSLKLIQKRK